MLLSTDPFGSIPNFAKALRSVAPQRQPWVILRQVLIALVPLLTFMFIGDAFLRAMNLSGLTLQIASGVILFHIALRMVFPDSQEADIILRGEPLIVPLAVPALVLPEGVQKLLGERFVIAVEHLIGLILVAETVEMPLRGFKQFAFQLA